MSDLAEILNVIFTHSGNSVVLAVVIVIAIGEGVVIKYLLGQVAHRNEKLDEILDHFVRKADGD